MRWSPRGRVNEAGGVEVPHEGVTPGSRDGSFRVSSRNSIVTAVLSAISCIVMLGR